jgi:hypothetical protein
MKTIYLQNKDYKWERFQYENIEYIFSEFKARNIIIRNYAKIGNFAKIGNYAEIGNYAKIGDHAEIGNYNAMFAINLYKYYCGAWVDKKVEWIQLGCFTRKRSDWDKDFWNNPNEFPDDNSEKSNSRLRAYKTLCFFLDQITSKQ